MTPTEQQIATIKRQRAIFAMRAEGATLAAIGKRFDISSVRVQQIIRTVKWDRKRYGDVTPEELIERRLAAAIEAKKYRAVKA